MPFNLQVITPEFIKDIAAYDVQSALEYVPGVVAATDTGATDPRLHRQLDPARRLRVAGPRRRGQCRPRIEVVRGPEAVLYGQGQPGGLLNYITKRPVFGQPGSTESMDFNFGSFRFKREAIDYNASNSFAAMRVLASNYKSDGYGQLVDPSLRAQPDEHGRAGNKLQAAHQHGHHLRCRIHHLRSGPSPTASSPWGNSTVGASSVPIPLIYNIDRPFASWNGPNFNDENSIRNFMVVVDQKLTDQLSFNVGYDWYDRTDHQYYIVNPAVTTGDPANPSATEIRGQYLHKINGNTDGSLRGDLLYKFDIGETKNQILVGYWSNNFIFRQAREQGMVPGPGGSNPVSTGNQDPWTNIAYYQNIFNTSTAYNSWFSITDPRPNLAVPGNMTWEYNPDFFLRQYSNEQYYYATYQGFYFNDKIITLLGVNNAKLQQFNDKPNGAIPQSHALIASGSQTSPLIGFIYRPIEPLSLYALTSSSLVLNSGQDGTGAFLPPRKGVSYEAGAKMDFWDGRLSGTLSFYDIKFKNRVQFDPNAPNVDPTQHGANELIGEDTSKGVDLDLLANPRPAGRSSSAIPTSTITSRRTSIRWSSAAMATASRRTSGRSGTTMSSGAARWRVSPPVWACSGLTRRCSATSGPTRPSKNPTTPATPASATRASGASTAGGLTSMRRTSARRPSPSGSTRRTTTSPITSNRLSSTTRHLVSTGNVSPAPVGPAGRF